MRLISILLLCVSLSASADEAQDWGKKMDRAFGKLMRLLPEAKKLELKKSQEEWSAENRALQGDVKIEHMKKRVSVLTQQSLAERERKTEKPLPEAKAKWGKPQTDTYTERAERKTLLWEAMLTGQKNRAFTPTLEEVRAMHITLEECCLEALDDAGKEKLKQISAETKTLKFEVAEHRGFLRIALSGPKYAENANSLDSKSMLLLYEKGEIRKVVHQSPGASGVVEYYVDGKCVGTVNPCPYDSPAKRDGYRLLYKFVTEPKKNS